MTMARIRDHYSSFSELQRAEQAGRDYRIVEKARPSSVVIIAPHGGGIEFGTSKIAAAIAGDTYSLYCFEGLKPSGNMKLHITSSRFDEPRSIALVATADYVVAIHGWSDTERRVYMGGLDVTLKKRIAESLKTVGVRTQSKGVMHLQAMSPNNICNRGRLHMGAQLEISVTLRNKLTGAAADPACFATFVDAVRSAIANVAGT